MNNLHQHNIIFNAITGSSTREFFVLDNGVAHKVSSINQDTLFLETEFYWKFKLIKYFGRRAHYIVSINTDGPISYFLKLTIPLKLGKYLYYKLLRYKHRVDSMVINFFN